MTNKFTQKAESSLRRALSCAEELGHTYIGSEHLLLALASEENSISASILNSAGIDKKLLIRKIKDITPEGSPSVLCPADMSPGVKQIIERASLEAQKVRASRIGTEHLLLSIIDHKSCVAISILEGCGAPLRDIKAELEAYIASFEKVKSSTQTEKPEPKAKIHGAPTLSLYGRDLSALCAKGAIDPIIDECDPIEDFYYLDVSSPGIERELRTAEHISRSIGERVEAKLFAAKDGRKSIIGTLSAFEDGKITITEGENGIILTQSEISKLTTLYFED